MIEIVDPVEMPDPIWAWAEKRKTRELVGTDREHVKEIAATLKDGETLEDAVYGTYLNDLYTLERMMQAANER